MGSILPFLMQAGVLLSKGFTAVEDAVALVNMIKGVVDRGTVTDADWTALDAYEAKQTAILDAPMEGE